MEGPKITTNKPEFIKEKATPVQDFFTQTERGKKLASKIELINQKILENPIKVDDLTGMNTSSLIVIAGGLAMMGKPYKDYVEKATNESIEDEKARLNIANNFENILDFYIKFNLPVDENIEKIISESIKLSEKGDNALILDGTPFRFKLGANYDDLFRRLSFIYLKNGDLKNSYLMLAKISNPVEKEAQLLSNMLKIEDKSPERKKLCEEIESDVLKNGVKDKESRNRLLNLINFYKKNEQIEEGLRLIDKLPDEPDLVPVLMEMAILRKKHSLPTDDIFYRAINMAEMYKSNHDVNIYSSIIAGYLNIGDIKNASLLMKKGIEYNAQFLNKISTEALLVPEVKNFALDIIKKDELFKKGTHPHQDLMVDVLTRAGEFEEAFDYISKEYMELIPGVRDKKPSLFLSKNLEKFMEGIGKRILTEDRIKNKTKESLYKEEDLTKLVREVFSSGNIEQIFSMTYYFGVHVKDINSYPNHVRIAYKTALSFRSDSNINENELGTLYEPIEIRAFLKSIEGRGFESIPGALEKIFNVMPEEGDNLVYQYISENTENAPRLIKTLVEIDSQKGTQYAVKLMSRKSVPDKIFTYLTRLCIENNRLSKNTEKLLNNEENIKYLRRLISQFPNQFNNVVDILEKLSVDDFSKEKDIWTALNEISPVTYGLYSKYRSLDITQKIEFKKWLENFDYSKFFKNEPVDFNSKDKDVFVDLLYRSYNPVNMSITDVESLIDQVPDRTIDLEKYKIREKYPVHFKTQKFEVKDGENINKLNFEKIKSLFTPRENDNELKEALIKLSRATTDFTHEEVRSIFSLLKDFSEYKNQNQSWVSGSREMLNNKPDMDTFKALSSSKELLTIFAEDNLSNAINSYTKKDITFKNRFDKTISRDERRDQIIKALGLKDQANSLEYFSTTDLISRLFTQKVLNKYVISANKELRKYVKSEDLSAPSVLGDCYISKNKGSFFSKSSAGLCTSKDIELWKNPNHFHINFVNQENQVKGLTMAYLENVNGKPSLVLRGFNPTVQYLEEISAVSFVEESIRVAKEFANDNKIEDVYIIDSSSDSLSNRPQIAKYVSGLVAGLEKVNHEMLITGTNKVSAVRKLKE